MLIAGLFTIAPNWKQLTYLSAGELITKFDIVIQWNTTQQ